MSAQLFSLPARATDSNGIPYSGAKLYFYATGTTNLQTAYADATLTTPLSDPVVADAGGRFVPIYINGSFGYRAVCKSFDGAVTLYDIDPVNPPGTAGTIISAGLIASEAIGAGSFVNIYDSSGSPRIRKADAALARPAWGYVAASVAINGVGTVLRDINASVSPVTFNGQVWLSDTMPGGYITTPIDPTDPANAGKLSQPLGIAIAGLGIWLNLQQGILL